METPLIFLRRISCPSRWYNLCPLFGRNKQELSMIFNTACHILVTDGNLFTWLFIFHLLSRLVEHIQPHNLLLYVTHSLFYASALQHHIVNTRTKMKKTSTTSPIDKQVSIMTAAIQKCPWISK